MQKFIFVLMTFCLFFAPLLEAKASKDNKKVEICHISKKDKDRDDGKTINISQNAVAAHLKHGDYLGKCVPEVCNLTVVSDSSTLIEGGTNAVASYVHPVWINPGTVTAFNSAIWIWPTFYVQNPTTNETFTFVKNFPWSGPIASAVLNIASDNSNEIYLNGNLIASNPQENNFSVGNYDTYNIQASIQNGNNILKIKVKNWALAGSNATSNPAGLLYRLDIVSADKDCAGEADDDNHDNNNCDD
jgi:hypothetical protein